MFGADYAWLLYGSVSDRWWLRQPPTGCRAAELRAATAGLLLVDSFSETRPGASPVSGLVREGEGRGRGRGRERERGGRAREREKEGEGERERGGERKRELREGEMAERERERERERGGGESERESERERRVTDCRGQSETKEG